jgi:ubiquinone/menaquinone biosynthesis C-methylase UbiE
VRHPIFARLYVGCARGADAKGAGAHREELLRDLSGRVLEVGCGHGANFPHYPPGVDVTALEPEPYLRHLAGRAARTAHVPIRVAAGMADDLPVTDATFDAAVASLVLCSVPDQDAALAELRRSLRPGGELRFYEHVVSSSRGFARAQRATDVVWPHIAGGCHTSRDTVSAIAGAGFEILDLRRFEFRPSIIAACVAPHVIGRARAT